MDRIGEKGNRGIVYVRRHIGDKVRGQTERIWTCVKEGK